MEALGALNLTLGDSTHCIPVRFSYNGVYWYDPPDEEKLCTVE